ncbi:hypothetical protein ACWDUL_23190 [Nocardia niigatensis]
MTSHEIAPVDYVRERKAFTLRTYGWTYDDIAGELGFASIREVLTAVRSAARRAHEPTVSDVRAEEEARYLAILRAWMPAAVAGDKEAASVVLKTQAARVKLHGAAVPTSVILRRGSADEFEDIGELLAGLGVTTDIPTPPIPDADEWASGYPGADTAQ